MCIQKSLNAPGILTASRAGPYVIATRVCVNWLRQQRPAIRSIDGMSVKEREQLSYRHYVSEQCQTDGLLSGVRRT